MENENIGKEFVKNQLEPFNQFNFSINDGSPYN